MEQVFGHGKKQEMLILSFVLENAGIIRITDTFCVKETLGWHSNMDDLLDFQILPGNNLIANK